MKTKQFQRGAALMEVLVSMLIVAFGILGFVGLQAQTTVSSIEGYQRTQALILANDMAQRISLNKLNAVSYVATNIGVADPGDCSIMTVVAEKDICEWAKELRGASEVSAGGIQLGAMIGARGCITSPAANQYLVSIAWQGIQPTTASPNVCGKDAYSAENMRRTVSTVVQVAAWSP